jgi:hypothetical protein
MANPTVPFSWQMPEPTDLVTNLPADFEVFGQAVATDLQYLLGGTTGQVLAKASGTDLDFDWVTDATGMTNPMTTTADVIYSSSGSTPARLGIGTANQVLAVNSGATAPEWQTISSGGMTLLASGNASTGSSTLVLSGISGAYNDLVFVASDFHPDTSARTISFTVNSVADYDYAIQTILSGTSVQDYGGVGAATIDPQYNSMSNANDENALRIQIFDYTNTNAYKLVNITHHFYDRLNQTNSLFAWGTIRTTSAIDSITINMNANFGTAGAYELYGVK